MRRDIGEDDDEASSLENSKKTLSTPKHSLQKTLFCLSSFSPPPRREQTAEKTKEVALATLDDLQEQGEQLGRVQRDLNVVSFYFFCFPRSLLLLWAKNNNSAGFLPAGNKSKPK